jgi:hypothetical protein
MKNLLLIIIAFLCLNQINSQNFDYGKVSKAELEEKYYPKDSSAAASILYRNEEIRFNYNKNTGFVQEREVHVRIKIYDKSGFDWASKKVYLYKGGKGNNDQIKGLKGITYNLENEKVNKDKLKSNGVFEEKVSENYATSSFTLPNVKAGSVIEYKYVLFSQLPLIDDISLQFSIPVKKLDVSIATPKMYRYNKILNPKASYLAKYVETINPRTISTTTKNVEEYRSTRTFANGATGPGMKHQSITYGSNTTNYHDNVIIFSEEDIPALKTESFAGSLNIYKAKLSMEFDAYLSVEGVVQQSFASSWDKISEKIYKRDDFGGQLNKSGFFKDDLSTLLSGVEDDFQKAFLIENLVKSKVKWNGNYSKYTQKGIRSAYKEGEGNVADINLLVTAMLRSQGVSANPVLISTRNNGVPLFPSREGFNYVICIVQSGSNYMLIDATEQYSGNNVLPERVLNWQGRVLMDDGTSRWVNVKPNKKSVESVMLNVIIDEDFNVTGKVRKNLTSYLALDYRRRNTNLNKDDHIKSIESNKGDLEISGLIYDNDKDVTKPVKIIYNYEVSDGVDVVGDKLYFSPLLFLATKDNPFKLEERLYPIDFVFPFEDKFLINIMIPEGYKTESLPESEGMAFKDGDAKFEYILQENGKYLQLKVRLEVNNSIVQPIDYKDFKSFFSKIIEKHAEQIVLIKV